MSCLILCQKQKANRPYYVENIHLNLYTIEELCFYICNNIYLINYDFITEELINWIQDELQLKDLAVILRGESIRKSISKFACEILKYVGFCDEIELDEIQHILVALKDETEEEQKKKKADNLLKNGKFGYAIREYELILQGVINERLGNNFYGKIYHNMGVSYARLFLFKEAAECFLNAFEIAGLDESLKEFIASSYFNLTEDGYNDLINSNESYKYMAEKMRNDLSSYENQYSYYKERGADLYKNIEQRIEDCKEEYRRSLL